MIPTPKQVEALAEEASSVAVRWALGLTDAAVVQIRGGGIWAIEHPRGRAYATEVCNGLLDWNASQNLGEETRKRIVAEVREIFRPAGWSDVELDWKRGDLILFP